MATTAIITGSIVSVLTRSSDGTLSQVFGQFPLPPPGRDETIAALWQRTAAGIARDVVDGLARCSQVPVPEAR